MKRFAVLLAALLPLVSAFSAVGAGDPAPAVSDIADPAPALPTLRTELLAMMAADQDARNTLIASNFKDEAAKAEMREIDRRHTTRMRAIIAATGWPTRAQVGADGASAAWLLVQHADADPAFQSDCLALMQPLVDAGEVAAKDVAYLTDRVLVNTGRRQRYGTQMEKIDGRWEPKPVEDPEHLDARRASVGLPSMDDYRKRMEAMYGKATSEAADG